VLGEFGASDDLAVPAREIWGLGGQWRLARHGVLSFGCLRSRLWRSLRRSQRLTPRTP